MVEQLRMPWMERIRTLFKFKGFQDAQKEHVIDIIDNSRIYFSEPGSFNDPFDYAPWSDLPARPMILNLLTKCFVRRRVT
jgi:hypothetical protein